MSQIIQNATPTAHLITTRDVIPEDPCCEDCVEVLGADGDAIKDNLGGLIDDFCNIDQAMKGGASDSWKRIFDVAYPSLNSLPLRDQLLCFAMFCVVQRVQSGGQYKFIEYWAGRGENTKAHDAAGLAKAVMFDKLLHASHNCLTAIGVRLWLDTLALTVERGVVWMATQCSSFIFMSKFQTCLLYTSPSPRDS